MPTTIPTPSINISASRSAFAPSNSTSTSSSHSSNATLAPSNHHTPLSTSSAASSPFNPGALAAAAALRRPSLVLSVGSFHSAQLRRPSFFAPFPYGQSPQQSDLAIHDYSSSPRRGDVYQRDLEDNYCKNFSCCGLTLGDLHALLQHYEEAHVRFEEDDDNGHPVPAGFTDEDGWSTGASDTTMNGGGRSLNNGYPGNNNSNSNQQHPLKNGSSSSSSATAAAAATVAALTSSHQLQQQKHTPISLLNANKKKSNGTSGNTSGGVTMSDLYSDDSGFSHDDAISAFPNSILRTAAQAEFSNLASKKRDLSTYSTSYDTHSPMSKKFSNLVTLTPSASNVTTTSVSTSSTSKTNRNNGIVGLALPPTSSGKESIQPSSSSGGLSPAAAKAQDEVVNTVTGYLEHAIQQGMLQNCGEVGSPQYVKAAEELIRKREEIMSIMESIGKPGSSGADKPYRCLVEGCDKAYKNPNGLKYHNQHGHCSTPGATEEDKLNAKPYRCTFLECGKCYKNLNGLKYHIEHSHPNLAAALHANIPGLATLEGGNVSQAAMAAAAAIAAVKNDPNMMAAAAAIMASAANSNTAAQRLSPPTDHTPDSSPNSSPVLAPAFAAGAHAGLPSSQLSNMTSYRGGDGSVFSTDVTPMTSPVLSRATLPGLNTNHHPLSIQTGAHSLIGLAGMATPSSLSPTLTSAQPRSPTSISQVSTLTAALAAVTVEQQRQQQQQLQQLQHQLHLQQQQQQQRSHPM
ncbi:transcription factor SFP1 [Entomortierella parvispora]|uniref:Transcription factor SFP1 n=1 Tax=Entomortierella parvispora TaxID=205924 RepID=A0A9P3HFH7_9FUNG|nr:transcription factor SFP1 [Entomortierella parvispora]